MLSVFETAKISFRSLRANKTRSALTMLGIVIGVMAVIIMFAVGSGANKEIAARFSSLGSNMIIVRPETSAVGGSRSYTAYTLTIGDADAIRTECSAVSYVAPYYGGSFQSVYGNENYPARIIGTTSDYLFVRDWTLASGRTFTEQDVRSATKVCIIGQTIVDNLFITEDPIGKIIRLKGVPMVVIGVIDKIGESAMGRDEDDVVLVPITTVQRRLVSPPKMGMTSSISVKALSSQHLEVAQEQIEALLAQRHRIRPGEENDFTVRNLAQMVENAKSATRVMSLLLTAVAGVSLLVGGIGIMNIMLVSVTERTREIGIRMAIGAKRTDIRLQFLVEALTLSLLGGVSGIILGIAGAQALSKILGWTVDISILSIVLSFGFSGCVGIFFGFYPAYKASLLNPIEALRYE
ncbi:MAG: ABC transporter permease [Aminobacterium sp.]|jgi:putative ABC transport system permease protein|uniref:ABC transporter permease n=1 Tax=unclassified Aminobacterium TaxID=2685012 RepID=UPI001BD13016|nr:MULTISPECIES: ABC transporter permease [unclassified Aminobacterium]MDD2207326.1 ABC transporter permease [Aminobacterium sp.]MDD3426742.1 ABC transporter permease [Aminobacterium sp.]MDD3707381.1 ABC transporter permease [Aminobacterium sp.]MDD4229383.1 ABC transporter permease [Aminobacterium sp.]MDD4552259.1 ABC transporter permease [Aminobacterium sp.]